MVKWANDNIYPKKRREREKVAVIVNECEFNGLLLPSWAMRQIHSYYYRRKTEKGNQHDKKSNVKEPFTHFFLFPSTSTQKDRKKRTEMKYNVVCICMYITTTKKIYIHKKTVHWSSTLRIVYIVIFSLSILLLTSLFLCVILHTILVVWGPRAPKHYSFLLHFSHKKKAATLVVWWRSSIECMNKRTLKLIENLRVCMCVFVCNN